MTDIKGQAWEMRVDYKNVIYSEWNTAQQLQRMNY